MYLTRVRLVSQFHTGKVLEMQIVGQSVIRKH